MEPLKNLYNSKSLAWLNFHLSHNSSYSFTKLENLNLEHLELKQRVELIAHCLSECFPSKINKISEIIQQSLAPERDQLDHYVNDTNDKLHGFILWPVTHFISTYYSDEFDESMHLLYEITKRFTCEFAIRTFIEKHEIKTFKLLNQWVKDPSPHVRRLVSEGTRPYLPWGKHVECLFQNNTRSLKLLEHLKDDPSEYVIKSVANHLNDYSRFDTSLLKKTLKAWNNDRRKKLIRRASRTLLKQGDPLVLKLNGYSSSPKVVMSNFKISNKKIKIGDDLIIELSLINNDVARHRFLLEYEVDFLKANGKYSTKVFRFKDICLLPSEKITLTKTVHTKQVTTRKIYAGQHYISCRIGKNLFTKRIGFDLI